LTSVNGLKSSRLAIRQPEWGTGVLAEVPKLIAAWRYASGVWDPNRSGNVNRRKKSILARHRSCSQGPDDNVANARATDERRPTSQRILCRHAVSASRQIRATVWISCYGACAESTPARRHALAARGVDKPHGQLPVDERIQRTHDGGETAGNASPSGIPLQLDHTHASARAASHRKRGV